MAFPWLNVQNLRDIVTGKNMMVASNALLKAEMKKQAAKIAKTDTRIRSAA